MRRTIVFLAFVLVAASCGGDDPSPITTPATTVSPPTTSAPSDLPLAAVTIDEIRWQEVTVDFPSNIDSHFGGFTGAPAGGRIALLTTEREPRLIMCAAGAECTTQTLELEPGSQPMFVRSAGGELWLLGSYDDAPAVWSSPDGAVWQRHDLPVSEEAQGQATNLVAHDDIVLVAGWDKPAQTETPAPAGPQLFTWTRDDGGFSAAANPPLCLQDAVSAAFVSGRPKTLVASTRGFVAGMPAGFSSSGPGTTELHFSTDGVTWGDTTLAMPAGFHVDDLAVAGTTYVAEITVGERDSVWVGADLGSWDEVPAPGQILGIDCGPDACAVLAEDAGTISVWYSSDGRAWNRSAPVLTLGADANMRRRGFVVGDGVAAVWGQTVSPDTIAPPRLWIGDIDDG